MSNEKEILVQSWSPVCNIQAFAEAAEDNVYFYLWIHPGSEYASVRSCWVCNTRKAPAELDMQAMEEGRAPMMPAEFCTHPEGVAPPSEESLEIVWFEEGDAAALVQDGSLLAVIPGWSGEGFYGYSRYCAKEGPFAWPLREAEPVLAARTEASRRFWASFDENTWPEVQQGQLQALESYLGVPHEKYFAIDGGEWPPKALITARSGDVQYAFTIGVGLIPQPGVEEQHQEEAPLFRRIELAFAKKEQAPGDWMSMLSYLSGQSGLPWGQLTWLGHGHTLPSDLIPGFEALLFVNANVIPGLPSPELQPIRGERINLLWAIPLTAEEYAAAREKGSQTLIGQYKGDLRLLPVFSGKAKFIGN